MGRQVKAALFSQQNIESINSNKILFCVNLGVDTKIKPDAVLMMALIVSQISN